jgi:hypothetical protein
MTGSGVMAGAGRGIVLAAATVVLAIALGPLATPAAPGACNGLPMSCAELVELGFTYPYPRPPTSYLFVDGAVYPYARITDRLLGDSVVTLPDGSRVRVGDLLADLEIRGRFDTSIRPVIGYGSNASPETLDRKFERRSFGGHAVIPTIKGTLRDYDVVFSPHFVANGSMPATLVPARGTTTTVWVNWLNRAENARMNESEGAGSLYAVGKLKGVDLRMPGPAVASPSVYIDCFGALTLDGVVQAVRLVRARGRTSHPVTEAQAMRSVLPHLGWRGSVFDLLLANVASTSGRDQRTRAIARLGRQIPDPHFHPQIRCAADGGTSGGRRVLSTPTNRAAPNETMEPGGRR